MKKYTQEEVKAIEAEFAFILEMFRRLGSYEIETPLSLSKEFNCSIESIFFKACAPKAPNIIAKKPKVQAARRIFFSMDSVLSLYKDNQLQIKFFY